MKAKTHLTALKRIHAEFKNLTQLATPEDPSDVADLLGELRFIETLIADWRKGLVVETDDAKGSGYQITTSNKCKRTFNIPRILTDVAAKNGTTVAEAMVVLQQRKAIKITGKWTGLKKVFLDFDVDLVIGKRDVTDADLDAPHVGEDWGSTRGVEAIKVGGK